VGEGCPIEGAEERGRAGGAEAEDPVATRDLNDGEAVSGRKRQAMEDAEGIRTMWGTRQESACEEKSRSRGKDGEQRGGGGFVD
jgi:hypothetical protein